jgi:SAM-dependent methyltransferase
LRQEASWRPTKYSMSRTGPRGTRDPLHLAPSSRLFATLIADFYCRAFPSYLSGGRLLDLGCGTVPLYGQYRPLVDAVTTADWPTSYHRLQHVDAYCDLNLSLPFRSDTFDAVLSSDVVEHLTDSALAVREIRRILKPGGVLLLNTPFLYPVHEAPHDYVRYTRFGLASLAERSGLMVESVEPIGGLTEVLVDLISKGLSGVPLVSTPLVVLLQEAAILTRNAALSRALRQASSAHLALGHALVARKPE